MEVPIGEVQQRFAEAMAAAENGEPVIVTHDGKPVAELKPVARRGFDFERAAQFSRDMGWDKYSAAELWPPEFDDPAFSRSVLGLE